MEENIKYLLKNSAKISNESIKNILVSDSDKDKSTKENYRKRVIEIMKSQDYIDGYNILFNYCPTNIIKNMKIFYMKNFHIKYNVVTFSHLIYLLEHLDDEEKIELYGLYNIYQLKNNYLLQNYNDFLWKNFSDSVENLQFKIYDKPLVGSNEYYQYTFKKPEDNKNALVLFLEEKFEKEKYDIIIKFKELIKQFKAEKQE